MVAGLGAAIVSGIPSTLCALITDGDPLEATRAAGSMVLPANAPSEQLLAAAVPVHLALSLGWGVVLAAVLPRRATALWGAVAGTSIAAFDLGIVGRRFPRVAALQRGPQIADHVAYGVTVGLMLKRLRRPPSGIVESARELQP